MYPFFLDASGLAVVIEKFLSDGNIFEEAEIDTLIRDFSD